MAIASGSMFDKLRSDRPTMSDFVSSGFKGVSKLSEKLSDFMSRPKNNSNAFADKRLVKEASAFYDELDNKRITYVSLERTKQKEWAKLLFVVNRDTTNLARSLQKGGRDGEGKGFGFRGKFSLLRRLLKGRTGKLLLGGTVLGLAYLNQNDEGDEDKDVEEKDNSQDGATPEATADQQPKDAIKPQLADRGENTPDVKKDAHKNIMPKLDRDGKQIIDKANQDINESGSISEWLTKAYSKVESAIIDSPNLVGQFSNWLLDIIRSLMGRIDRGIENGVDLLKNIFGYKPQANPMTSLDESKTKKEPDTIEEPLYDALGNYTGGTKQPINFTPNSVGNQGPSTNSDSNTLDVSRRQNNFNASSATDISGGSNNLNPPSTSQQSLNKTKVARPDDATLAELMKGTKPTDIAVDKALQLEGMNEHSDRAKIKEYLRTGGVNMDPATTAWCAATVNSSLAQAGIKGTDSQVANSFQRWGVPVDAQQGVQKGDVIIQTHGRAYNEVGGHVGFATGRTDPKTGKVEFYSGNSSDQARRLWISPGEQGTMIRRAGKNELPELTPNASPADPSAARKNLPTVSPPSVTPPDVPAPADAMSEGQKTQPSSTQSNAAQSPQKQQTPDNTTATKTYNSSEKGFQPDFSVNQTDYGLIQANWG